MSRALTAGAAIMAVAASSGCAAYNSNAGGLLSLSLTSAARTPRSEVLANSGGTYIDRLLADRDSMIERWPSRVVRVWIDNAAHAEGMESGYPDAVRAAFEEWTTTGIPVRFAFVQSAHDADIRVRWTNHLDHKTGSTTWRTDRRGWLQESDILLATHISDGQSLDSRGMRAIALHEVGHALGLSHSLSPRDIMAALVRVDGLSDTDRNTIKLLYSFDAGPVG